TLYGVSIYDIVAAQHAPNSEPHPGFGRPPCAPNRLVTRVLRPYVFAEISPRKPKSNQLFRPTRLSVKTRTPTTMSIAPLTALMRPEYRLTCSYNGLTPL